MAKLKVERRHGRPRGRSHGARLTGRRLRVARLSPLDHALSLGKHASMASAPRPAAIISLPSMVRLVLSKL